MTTVIEDRSPPPAPAEETTPLSLLQRARRNEADAWHRLVALYRPLVLFWSAKSGVRGPDAEDVAQEVFAAAARGLAQFRRDRPGDSFRGWLHGITRNHVLLHFRRRQHQPEAEGGSEFLNQLRDVPDPLAAEAGADEAAPMSELYRQLLEQVRGEFEPKTWQAFWLTVIDGRAPAALAAELGMSPASIRQAKSRVLRRLRQELGELLG